MPQTTPTTDRPLNRTGAPRAGAPRRPRSRATSVRRPAALAAARRSPQLVGGAGLHRVLPAVFDSEHGETSFLLRLAADGWRAESCAVALSEVHCFADWLAQHPQPGVSGVRAATARTITEYRNHLLRAELSVPTPGWPWSACACTTTSSLAPATASPTRLATSRFPPATYPTPPRTPTRRSPPSTPRSPTPSGRRGRPETPPGGCCWNATTRCSGSCTTAASAAASSAG